MPIAKKKPAAKARKKPAAKRATARPRKAATPRKKSHKLTKGRPTNADFDRLTFTQFLHLPDTASSYPVGSEALRAELKAHAESLAKVLDAAVKNHPGATPDDLRRHAVAAVTRWMDGAADIYSRWWRRPVSAEERAALVREITSDFARQNGYGRMARSNGVRSPSYPFLVVERMTGRVQAGAETRNDAEDMRHDLPTPAADLQVLTREGVRRKFGRISWASVATMRNGYGKRRGRK